MKKIKWLLLFAILVFSLSILPVAAEGESPGAIALSVDAVEGYAGDTVKVLIRLDQNAGLCSLHLSISYQTDALQLTSISEKGLFGKWFVSGEELTATPYQMLWISATPVDAVGTLVELSFKINEEAETGSYDIVVAVNEALDGDKEAVAVANANGSVTVKCRHSFGEWQKVDEQRHQQTCSLCGESEIADHSWQQTDVHSNGACDENGTVDYSCKDCKATKTTPYQPSVGHSFGAWQDEANGNHTRACKVCEKTETEAHTWNGGTVQADQPCDEDGTILYTCTKCALTRSEDYVPTGEHQWSNCVSAGNENHVYRCSVCYQLKDEVHDWNQGVVSSDKACDENAKITYTCTDCGEVKVQSYVPTEAHQFGLWQKKDEDTHQHTCNECGKLETAEHAWRVKVEYIDGACDEHGMVEFECTLCGEDKIEAYIPTEAHSYGAWEQLNALLHKHICSTCGASEIKEHRWDEGTVNVRGACDEAGEIVYTCLDCGVTNVERYLPTAGHQFGAYTKKDDYLHQHICTVCQKEEIKEHAWSVKEEHIDGACDEDGTVELICSDCSATYFKAYVPSVAHQYGVWQNVDAEKHERVCTECEKRETADHTWDSGAIHVEYCGGEGTIEYACTGCGAKKTEPYVSDVNHTYNYQKKDGDTHTYECIICHDAGGTAPHAWNEGVPNVKGACDENGTVTYTCTDCGATKTMAFVPTEAHAHGAWEKVSDLEHRRTCSVCNHEEKKEHAWDEGVIHAVSDCDESGYRLYSCLHCATTKQIAIATGSHSFGDWTYQSTSNCMERICEKCQKRETQTVSNTPPTSSGGVQILPDEDLYFPAGTELIAQKIGDSTESAVLDEIAPLLSTVTQNGTAFIVYDISLMAAGKKVTVGGEMTISIPLSSEELAAYDSVSIYYLSESGKLYACPTTAADGAVQFTTLYDGRFVVVGNQVEQEKGNTGWVWILVCSILVVGAGGAGVFLFLKKKQAISTTPNTTSTTTEAFSHEDSTAPQEPSPEQDSFAQEERKDGDGV